MKTENKIIILDENTVNKIAAGEVIERPASVVKELVENAIDAGSTQITIELIDGGKSLIKVIDNGCGMSKADAVIAPQKHATSKIRKIEDLRSLRTLGFRGEALSSICAVAKVELRTKLKSPSILIGTNILIESGEIKEVKDIGAPSGTTVTVKELFYNLPVRQKYLKSVRTELAHIADLVTRLTLTYPNIHFKLIHNGVEIINSPSTLNQYDTIINIYGPEIAKALIPIDFKSKGLRITGYTSNVSIARASSEQQSIFVNNRYVASRMISNAIKEAYGTLLPKDKYPITVLNIEIDPALIDVNVHPTKNQIRFIDEKEVYFSVATAIDYGLATASRIPKIEKPQITKKLEPIPQLLPERIPELKKEPLVQKFEGIEPQPIKPVLTKEAVIPDIKLIGVIYDTFIVGESKEGMIIMDQHAVHERVLYDKIKEDYERTSIPSQELIVPFNINLTPKEAALIEQYSSILEKMGFELEPFGHNTHRIKKVPIALGEIVEHQTLHDIFEDILSLPKQTEESAKDQILKIIAEQGATTACKHAIKAGDKTDLPKLREIVQRLWKSKNPYTCPHGRPTTITLTKEELEKRFKRT